MSKYNDIKCFVGGAQMNDRFRFRIPITNKYGKFKKFVYFDLFNQPAITCRASDIFQNTEQCTGLKDKNGRLIYENDILQLERKDGCGREEYHYVINAKIERQKNGQYIAIGNGSRYYCWETNLDLVTVIGNIHENPELLEGKK